MRERDERNAERRRRRYKRYREANRETLTAKALEYQRRNPEKTKKTAKRYRIKNKEKLRARNKAWRSANPERARRAALNWKAKNRERTRELSRKSASEWKKTNKAKARAHEAAREAAKRNATPLWAEQSKIQAFYAEAAEMTADLGTLHHVDHIVPLNSRIVCGLHWEVNLQVLPFRENIAKGNRHWPDMP